jgi:hypothetical protein
LAYEETYLGLLYPACVVPFVGPRRPHRAIVIISRLVLFVVGFCSVIIVIDDPLIHIVLIIIVVSNKLNK